MATNSNKSLNSRNLAASDVCLLLRAHAETRWLSHEVLPVLRELEQGASRSEEQRGAALAYLEALWIEACGRAAETEAARVELDDVGAISDRGLYEKAHRYHAAVRRLRKAIIGRVDRLLAVAGESSARQAISE
jgi:hypothetical protein